VKSLKIHHYFRQILAIYNDPLFRGFFFITNILLGISLEQGLLDKPALSNEISFLVGNFLGLYIAIFLWRLPKYALRFGLKLWFFEGLLVGLLLIYNNFLLFFLQGLIFGALTLHIYLTAYKRPFREVLFYVALGIIVGNVFLYLLKQLPNKKVSVLIIALLLVGWRIKKPSRFDFGVFSFAYKRRVFFWAFLFIFYFLGGFYYSYLFSSLSMPRHTFDIISFLPYSIAVAIGLLLSPRFYYFFPLVASLVIGLSLVWHLSSLRFSFLSLSFLEMGFGFSDMFCMTYILSRTSSLLEGAFSFSLFPLAILISIYVLHRYDSSFLKQYQWALTSIFFAVIPSIFLIQRKEHVTERRLLLALPAEPEYENESKEASTDVEEEESLPLEEMVAQIDLPLSIREKEVFVLLIQGYKLKDISSELDLALGTVKSICSRLYEKLEVKNKQELAERYGFLLNETTGDKSQASNM